MQYCLVAKESSKSQRVEDGRSSPDLFMDTPEKKDETEDILRQYQLNVSIFFVVLYLYY